MSNVATNKLYGVVDGVYICNTERTQELSDRMFSRNVPSNILQPQFSMRPVSTKYALMPIIDQRQNASVPLTKIPAYNTNNQFNPGNAQAPWSGYATNINVESELKNQLYALQRAEQSNYVPSSQSDLYNETIQAKNTFDDSTENPNHIISDTHTLLFKEQHFNNFNPNTCNLGSKLFQNHTRQQRMDLK
jgi:hypothetical protein